MLKPVVNATNDAGKVTETPMPSMPIKADKTNDAHATDDNTKKVADNDIADINSGEFDWAFDEGDVIPSSIMQDLGMESKSCGHIDAELTHDEE